MRIASIENCVFSQNEVDFSGLLKFQSLSKVITYMAKVMIFDHELMNVIAMEKMLVEAGYEVVTLTGPYGVLAKFDFEKPDILLFNLDMPNFDTDVLLDTVIHAPQTRNMAVIALATGDAQAVEEYCKSQNVHGFFMKDQGLDSLVAYLANFIKP